MYEDAWYNSFIPRTQPAPEKPTKHRRRQSLLKQPNESNEADSEPVGAIIETIEDLDQQDGPPKATVARRAKSYSDFYDVVRAHLKKERDLEKQKMRRKEEIRTEFDFGQWYSDVSDELIDASHGEYQLYRDQLQLTQSHLDSLLSGTSSALELLASLSASFRAVEEQTSAFQKQCEGLVADQRKTTKLADDIVENLNYYAYLEPITRRLNAPGAGNFVRGKEFSDMLSNLDSCLEYMQAHPNHLESATYRSRYRLLLTRGLTLIRVHFTNTLREIAADVSKRIADRQLNDTTMSALLYAKFRVPAPELKRIGLEIQKRAVLPEGADTNAEPEYQSLLNELYESYSTTRGRLILPIISKKMNEIALAPSTSKDLVAFARSAISYVRGICFDEYELWGEWFDGEGALYDFLEALCEPLYDHLRPRTIHETQLLKLCELCTLIQTRYMEEESEDDISEPEILLPKLSFSRVIRPALQDAQARLVFLAEKIIRDDIERYKPKPEDLEYPKKERRGSASSKSNHPILSGKKSRNGSLPTATPVDEESEARWGFSTEAAFKDCYPTLRRAIWLLSKIYRLVNSTVFDSLAHQIVHSTTHSLIQASTQIAKSASPTDAQLFLIHHLLTLKQQIVAFDIEFADTDLSLDFSSVAATFAELRSHGGLFDLRKIMGLLPRVVEDMVDAKAELDARLRAAINEFVGSFAERITLPLKEEGGGGGTTADEAQLLARMKKAQEAARKTAPFLRQKLEEYVQDVRTRETLVAAVADQVVGAYEVFWEQDVLGGQNGVGLGRGYAFGKGKGKGREDRVWDPDAFGEWCEEAFGLGRVALGTGSPGAGDAGDDEDEDAKSV